jgi:2-polyprenyl-3-methyl-5-hydroxy-6-metoxy-1,4-benzoquinol methylase
MKSTGPASVETMGQDASAPVVPSYRERLYERYATTVQIPQRPLTPANLDRWAVVWAHYLRGWLPADRNAAILDVACGAGRLLWMFAKGGYTNVRGIDISAEQVVIARQIHPHVEQGEIISFLRERPEQFDVITGMDIVEHFTKDEILTFMDVCRRALRPGGRLILQTPNGESPWVGENWTGDLTHETCLNPKSLGQLFALCGFEGYEAREAAPVPHGLASTMRYVLWSMIRRAIRTFNLVETGMPGSGVFTRVFIGSGIKK